MRTPAMPPLRRGSHRASPNPVMRMPAPPPPAVVSTQFARLQPHPATAALAVRELAAEVCVLADGSLRLTYRLSGDMQALRLPPPGHRRRRHGLWRHTCFEAFVALDDTAYLEWNFSPGGAWQLYRMRAYRAPDTPPRTVAPRMVSARAPAGYALRVHIPSPAGCDDARLRLGLSAVLRTRDGVLTYWALRHPAERPDFHHPDGFTLSIA